jgi:MYXO-CTERM domain-containing protein
VLRVQVEVAAAMLNGTFKGNNMKSTWILALTLTLAQGTAFATSANYSDFSDTTGLTINGDAAQAGTVLRLVPDLQTQSGTAFLTSAVSFDASTGFTTAFKFNVATDVGNPTDGFAFLLQNDAAGNAAVGGAGQGLGYVGLTPSVAVVFRGRNPNLIGVITGGVDPADLATAFQPAGFYTGPEGEFYNKDEYAWIDYTPGTLKVYLSDSAVKPGTAIMTAPVNVFATLGTQAFVGFSAGNGGAFGTQDIQSWSFATAPVPEPATAAMWILGLAALPLLRRRLQARTSAC